jgi:hypothetical protein
MGSIGRAWWDGAEDLFGARAFDLCEPRYPRVDSVAGCRIARGVRARGGRERRDASLAC